jgi:hypothetical protein
MLLLDPSVHVLRVYTCSGTCTCSKKTKIRYIHVISVPGYTGTYHYIFIQYVGLHLLSNCKNNILKVALLWTDNLLCVPGYTDLSLYIYTCRPTSIIELQKQYFKGGLTLDRQFIMCILSLILSEFLIQSINFAVFPFILLIMNIPSRGIDRWCQGHFMSKVSFSDRQEFNFSTATNLDVHVVDYRPVIFSSIHA